ncbi:MAG: PilZ domain-containing protein [Acidobacteriota bacterium]
MLIAADHLLPALKQQTQTLEAEIDLVAFADTDVLLALEAIGRRRPRLVALEKGFADSSRGAALIRRLKADARLGEVEIRVVSETTQAVADPGPALPAGRAPAGPIDYRGTRGAPRYKVAAGVAVDINGNGATVVDLSTVGAQVVSATILKPNQRVRVTLSDAQMQLRCQAVVAWASFEMPPGSVPCYRAGLQFLDANAETLDAFRIRHQSL